MKHHDITFVPRRSGWTHSKEFYHMGTAEERMRRKPGSNLDVTVAATNWTSTEMWSFAVSSNTPWRYDVDPLETASLMCVAGCWQIRALLHGAKSAATPAFFLPLAVVLLENPPEEHVWGIGWLGWVECFSDLPCPQTLVVSLFKPQFMTPPSQQRIEGKWVSVCQLWAMMTQEERESSIPSCQKEIWSRWRRKTWVLLGAQASHHITLKPGGFEYVWITQYLAKQQDQVWMVQAPHFPSPKEENHLKCKVSFCIFKDHNSGDGTIPEVSRQRLGRKVAQIQVEISVLFTRLLRSTWLEAMGKLSDLHEDVSTAGIFPAMRLNLPTPIFFCVLASGSRVVRCL